MPTAADEARAVLSDPRAPADERFDARSAMERRVAPTSASDLLPAELLNPVIKAVRGGMAADDIAKAARRQATSGGDGGSPLGPSPRGKQGMRSVRVSAQKTLMQGDEYVEKPGAIDFAGLRAMVVGTPVLAAVVATRIRQVLRFCSPSEDGGPGFEIRHVDKDHEVTEGEKEQMRLLSRFITNGGWEFNPRKRKQLKRDTFPVFMSKLVRDSLTMDASPFETEMRRNGQGIDGLYALDAATVRLCSDEGHRGDDEVFALQIVDGKVATLYGYDQLCYEVRNPRTDLELAGYGFGETEVLIRTITALLGAHTYNQDFFDNNSIPKGILQVFGDYADQDVDQFKRHWSQMVTGAAGHWSLPLLVAKDKEAGALYTPFNAAASEMAFAKWMTFLISVVCAVYNIDPAEINFESFAAAKSSLSGSDTGERMESSRDKGFRPIMSHFEGVLSDFVIADFNDNFCLRFAGLEEEDRARIWEAKKIILTVDEMRAEEGHGPHPNPKIGALPVNKDLIPAAMTLQNPGPEEGDFGAMAPEQQEPGEDFGGEKPEPEEPGEDFGADAPEQPDPGDDFGGEAPAPAEPGDDAGADAPEAKEPGDDYGAEPPEPEEPKKPKKPAKSKVRKAGPLPEARSLLARIFRFGAR